MNFFRYSFRALLGRRRDWHYCGDRSSILLTLNISGAVSLSGNIIIIPVVTIIVAIIVTIIVVINFVIIITIISVAVIAAIRLIVVAAIIAILRVHVVADIMIKPKISENTSPAMRMLRFDLLFVI